MVHTRKKIKKRKAGWHTDTEDGWTEQGVESIVHRGFYKGFQITVYPTKLLNKNEKGWEYRLSHKKKTGEDDWDSWGETSTGGDHANTPEEAKRWALNTIDEWD